MGLISYLFGDKQREADQAKRILIEKVEQQLESTELVKRQSDRGDERNRQFITVLDDIITKLEPKNANGQGRS